MKNIVITVLGLSMLVGCHNYKKDAKQLKISSDSLIIESAYKDSSIIDFLNDFNEIQANLDSIKKFEKLVTVESNRGIELSSTQKKKILDDIALLNELLQKNKELTATLQKKLNQANFKAGKLEAMISEFKLMVGNLEKQVHEKDVEILNLNEKVSKLNVDISSLNQKIGELAIESQRKSETIESQTSLLNKAFFAFGSVKELKDNGVIKKSGGLLGIGRTPALMKDFNRDYFTEIDIRKFKFLPLLVKKAKIVSVHPASSYHITGEKKADTLFIDDRAEFWKTSKYLIIITDQ